MRRTCCTTSRSALRGARPLTGELRVLLPGDRDRCELEVQGLSLNELAVLSHLAETPNRTRRRQDLADSLGMTPSGITRLLAPLEKLGYVTRVADPRDARLALVVLTDAGTERTHDAVAEAEERATSLFDHAFETDEQETLDDLLAALVPFT